MHFSVSFKEMEANYFKVFVLYLAFFLALSWVDAKASFQVRIRNKYSKSEFIPLGVETTYLGKIVIKDAEAYVDIHVKDLNHPASYPLFCKVQFEKNFGNVTNPENYFSKVYSARLQGEEDAIHIPMYRGFFRDANQTSQLTSHMQPYLQGHFKCENETSTFPIKIKMVLRDQTGDLGSFLEIEPMCRGKDDCPSLDTYAVDPDFGPKDDFVDNEKEANNFTENIEAEEEEPPQVPITPLLLDANQSEAVPIPQDIPSTVFLSNFRIKYTSNCCACCCAKNIVKPNEPCQNALNNVRLKTRRIEKWKPRPAFADRCVRNKPKSERKE